MADKACHAAAELTLEPCASRPCVGNAPPLLALPIDLLLKIISDDLSALRCYQLRYVCKKLHKLVSDTDLSLDQSLPVAPEDLSDVWGIQAPQCHWWKVAVVVLSDLAGNKRLKCLDRHTRMLLKFCVSPSTSSDSLELSAICFFLGRFQPQASHMGYYKSRITFRNEHCFRHFRHAEQCIQFGSGMFVHELIRRQVFPSYSSFFVRLCCLLDNAEEPFTWTTADVAHLLWAVEVTSGEIGVHSRHGHWDPFEYHTEGVVAAGAPEGTWEDLPGPWAVTAGRWHGGGIGRLESIMEVLRALQANCAASLHGVIAEMIAPDGWLASEVAYLCITHDIKSLFERLVHDKFITKKSLPALGLGFLRHVQDDPDEYSSASCDVRESILTYARCYTNLLHDSTDDTQTVRTMLAMTSHDEDTMKAHFPMLFKLHIFSSGRGDIASSLNPIEYTDKFQGESIDELFKDVFDVVFDVFLDYHYNVPSIKSVDDVASLDGVEMLAGGGRKGQSLMPFPEPGALLLAVNGLVRRAVDDLNESASSSFHEDAESRLASFGQLLMTHAHETIMGERWGAGGCNHSPQCTDDRSCSAIRRQADCTTRPSFQRNSVETWCFKPDCSGRERQRSNLYQGCRYLHRLGLLVQANLGLSLVQVGTTIVVCHFYLPDA
jgi:hypothetical protein